MKPEMNRPVPAVTMCIMKTYQVIAFLATATLMFGACAGSAEGDTDMIAIGEKFVEFELPAHDGTSVSSRDLEGRPYLLFFYPKADTPG
jgi:cytochrome oxidase Cu insertion factor (SCO1/SenC/PrrC family)